MQNYKSLTVAVMITHTGTHTHTHTHRERERERESFWLAILLAQTAEPKTYDVATGFGTRCVPFVFINHLRCGGS